MCLMQLMCSGSFNSVQSESSFEFICTFSSFLVHVFVTLLNTIWMYVIGHACLSLTLTLTLMIQGSGPSSHRTMFRFSKLKLIGLGGLGMCQSDHYCDKNCLSLLFGKNFHVGHYTS